MRILAISDIHGNRTKLRDVLAQAAPADLIVLAGDITHLGNPDEAQEIVALCRQHTPEVLTVTGNCDDELIEKTMMQDGHSLTGAGRIIGDTGFFGVSAAQPFIGNTWEVEESQLAAWAAAGHAAVAHAPRKALISHPPPHGFVDMSFNRTHGGSQAIREALDLYRVGLVVCGHIHEARGVATHGDAVIVNCGPAWMGYFAEIAWDSLPVVQLRQAP